MLAAGGQNPLSLASRRDTTYGYREGYHPAEGILRTRKTGEGEMTTIKFVEWWARQRLAIYQAAREVGTIAVITLTPVWAGVLLSLLLQELPSFEAALHANTDRGDLYLLSTAAIAPLALYISVRQNALPKPFTIHFPGGWLFIVLLLFLFGGSATLFAVKRMADLPNSTLHIDQSLFFHLSFVIYALSLLVALIVTSIKYALDAIKPEVAFREDTEEFLAAWSRRDR